MEIGNNCGKSDKLLFMLSQIPHRPVRFVVKLLAYKLVGRIVYMYLLSMITLLIYSRILITTVHHHHHGDHRMVMIRTILSSS